MSPLWLLVCDFPLRSVFQILDVPTYHFWKVKILFVCLELLQALIKILLLQLVLFWLRNVPNLTPSELLLGLQSALENAL